MVTRNQKRYIDFLARESEYGEAGEVFENMIQMVVHGPIYGTPNEGDVGIWLTEQEQDDLIAGILERRGVQSYKLGDRFPEKAISAIGNEQSRIHPAND